ncbi:MAG: DUF6263 family protein [Isosphaeraceae bacterium]|nr:DUF6263 family protein [Isosphaeraceae bacterium]
MLRRALVCSLALSLGTASIAVAQVKLEYKHKEGRASGFTSTVKAQQVLTLGGMSIESTSEQVTSGTSKVGKRAADGTLPIAQTIDAMRIQIEAGGMTFTFDSADPNAKPALPQLAFVSDIIKALVGKQLTVVLDDKNQVKAVDGADKIADAAKDLDPMAQELLKPEQVADRYKQQFEKSQGNLPQILVREGETWEHTDEEPIGNGQTLTFRRRYEYKGTVEKNGRTLDKIAITALDVNYKMDPEAKSPLKPTKSELKIESSEGHMLFDRDAGELVERKEVDRIKGTIDFKANDQEIPGKLDLTYETVATRQNAK